MYATGPMLARCECLRDVLARCACWSAFLATYLEVLLDDATTHEHAALRQVDAGQGDEGLADDAVAGEAVEAEHVEVQRQLRHAARRDPVEAEGLVKGRVQGLAEHTGLDTVLLLRQQCQLDVGVGGQ